MITELRNAYIVLVKERRLPISWDEKIQKLLHKKPLENALKKYANGTAIACRPSSNVELHMVTCKRDLYMAISACKSFLRFYDQVSIVFHSDGSLTDTEESYLLERVPGSLLYTKNQADEAAKKFPLIFDLRQKLPNRFNLSKLYTAQKKAWAMKVFDFHILSAANKILVLDSDTLFLKNPVEIIHWIKHDSSTNFHSVPKFSNLKISKNIFSNFFPDNSIIEKFNGGLFGFNKHHLTEKIIVDVCEKIIKHGEIPVYGDECIWRIALGETKVISLDFDKYPLVTDRSRAKNLKHNLNSINYLHFIIKYRFGLYKMIVKKNLLDFR